MYDSKTNARIHSQMIASANRKLRTQVITHWEITFGGRTMTANTEHGREDRVVTGGGVLPLDAFLAGVERARAAGAEIKTSETIFEF